MIVTRISSYPDFITLNQEWNSLLVNSNQKNIFLSHEWLISWWDVYGEDKELFVLLCRKVSNNELVGAFPLYRTVKNRLFPVKVLNFIAGSDVGSDFLEPLASLKERNEIYFAFCKYLLDNQNDWNAVELSAVNVDSHYYYFMMSDGSPFIVNSSGEVQLCPYLCLPSAWEELTGNLSKKTYKKIGYTRRSLERKGKYEVYRIMELRELDQALTDLIRMRTERLENKNVQFKNKHRNYEKFHKKIMSKFLRNDWLQLYFLKIDNVPIAFAYQFAFENRIFFYQTAFDNQWSSKSVGFVLLSHVLQKSIVKKYSIFEFLRGDEKYKYDWNVTGSRKISDVFFYSESILSKIYKMKNNYNLIFLKKVKDLFKKHIKCLKNR